MIRVLTLLLAIPLAAATYEDPEGAFHFDLPSGWTARVQGRLPEETPITFSRGRFSCDVTVLVQEGGGTLDEAASELESGLAAQGDVVREEAKVDGTPAVRLTLTPEDASLGVTVVLVVVRDNVRLVVELRADRDAWGHDRASYEVVLAGFHRGEPAASGGGFVSANFAVPDDGTQLVAGNPPLTWREVSGCLGAIEFAYGIELTCGEMDRLKNALLRDFQGEGDAARRAIVDLSALGWNAREAEGAEAEAARESIATRVEAGMTVFDREAAAIVASASPTSGRPAAHDMAVAEEWAGWVWLFATDNNTIGQVGVWATWAQADDAVSDVEWMALRAAISLASSEEREAYRQRLLAALGGTAESAAEAMILLDEKDVPRLGAKLREAARPLLETLTPPVDLTDPGKNGAIRYRY